MELTRQEAAYRRALRLLPAGHAQLPRGDEGLPELARPIARSTDLRFALNFSPLAGDERASERGGAVRGLNRRREASATGGASQWRPSSWLVFAAGGSKRAFAF